MSLPPLASPSPIRTRQADTIAEEARDIVHVVARKHLDALRRRKARSQPRHIDRGIYVGMVDCPAHHPITPSQQHDACAVEEEAAREARTSSR